MVSSSASDGSMSVSAAAVDAAAESLLAIFEAAREQARTRLSGSQLRALLVVQGNEGLNLRALADGMGIILSSASRLCDRLIAAGMLERGISQVDRREVSLTLTPYGREVLHNLRDDRLRRLERVLDKMGPASRTALLRGLREFTRVSNKNALIELSA
jgi:DNA-binding MarR family transcriptional regulator